ncbi:MAG: hypothetical protein R3E73_08595 [Porticoccaceae bacterium]
MISFSLLTRTAVGLAFILYPLLVYLGLRSFEPRLISFMLVVVIGIRFVSGGKTEKTLIYWAVAASLSVGFTLLTGSRYGLLFYPVLINITFLCLFLASLLNPPSIIEKLARLKDPDIPHSAIPYTRKVTIVWCYFFFINGAIAFITVYLNEYWWLLYNGLISYLLIALLVTGEMLFRRKIIERRHD